MASSFICLSRTRRAGPGSNAYCRQVVPGMTMTARAKWCSALATLPFVLSVAAAAQTAPRPIETPPLVHRNVPGFSRGRCRRRARRQAADGVLRSGRLSVLQAADADDVHRNPNCRQGPTQSGRDRPQPVGGPRGDLGRWPEDVGEGTGPRPGRAVHSDAAVSQRKGGGDRPTKRISASPPGWTQHWTM